MFKPTAVPPVRPYQRSRAAAAQHGVGLPEMDERPNHDVTITLTSDEAVVLFEFLRRFSDTDKLTIEDQAATSLGSGLGVNSCAKFFAHAQVAIPVAGRSCSNFNSDSIKVRA